MNRHNEAQVASTANNAATATKMSTSHHHNEAKVVRAPPQNVAASDHKSSLSQ